MVRREVFPLCKRLLSFFDAPAAIDFIARQIAPVLILR
jgi:hypothetical protein